MLQRLIAWWRRPSARNRILTALSVTEWQRGLDIIKTANIHIGQFYAIAGELEAEGVIETMWDENPPSPNRGYRPNKLFRLKPGGKRSHPGRKNDMPVRGVRKVVHG